MAADFRARSSLQNEGETTTVSAADRARLHGRAKKEIN